MDEIPDLISENEEAEKEEILIHSKPRLFIDDPMFMEVYNNYFSIFKTNLAGLLIIDQIIPLHPLNFLYWLVHSSAKTRGVIFKDLAIHSIRISAKDVVIEMEYLEPVYKFETYVIPINNITLKNVRRLKVLSTDLKNINPILMTSGSFDYLIEKSFFLSLSVEDFIQQIHTIGINKIFYSYAPDQEYYQYQDLIISIDIETEITDDIILTNTLLNIEDYINQDLFKKGYLIQEDYVIFFRIPGKTEIIIESGKVIFKFIYNTVIYLLDAYYETVGYNQDLLNGYCGSSHSMRGFRQWADEEWNVNADTTEELCQKVQNKIIESAFIGYEK